MKTLFIGILLIISQLSNAQNAKDSLGIELTQIINDSDIPGLGVSLVGERGILYSKGFGLRDIANNTPYDSLTVQSVASVSKTMIAVSLMKLVEDGKVNLDEDINTYLPFKVINPNYPNAKITLLHLVTHTSSIIETDEVDDGSYYIIEKDASKRIFPKGDYRYYKKHLKNKNTDIEDYLESYLSRTGKKYGKSIFGKYSPGEQYAYTNIGATLVAYIIEIVSGETFEEFTKESIFNPLGMENTSWKLSNSTNQASQYFHNGCKAPEYSLITFPSGDLLTNSYDIGRFMSEILNGYSGTGKLLSPQSYQFMLSNHIALEGSKVSKGVFWDIGSQGIGHGGAEIGTTCQLIFSPGLNKAFFIMINMSVYDQAHLEKDYIKILMTMSKYAKRID